MTQKVKKFKLLNNCAKHPPLKGYCLTYHITNTLNFKTFFVYRMASLVISEVKSLKDLYLIMMCRIGRAVMKMCGEDVWEKAA